MDVDTYLYEDDSWGDRLTKYNGTEITYDTIGNPLIYNNGSAYTFTWTDGRRLATATKDAVAYAFTYNEEGIRTSKTVGGVKHIYTLDGSRIVSEQWGNHFVLYLYDESGAPVGMQYRMSSYAEGVFDTFYFEKNLQGDIVSVYNENGVKLVSYVYDAWGNFETYTHTTNIGGAQYNPFRYRGYFYDADLGLYYLNSRYYDSNTGRFLNADGQLNGGLLGYNQFAYCLNNPIIYADYFGDFTLTLMKKKDEENSFSEPDYWKMTDFDVDSYIVDTKGNVFMLPYDANNFTEAVRIYDITIHIMD